MAEVQAPVEVVPPALQEHLQSRPSAAEDGAKRPRLPQVDSGFMDALTDGESSGSEDSFFPDDANAADINIMDTGRSTEEALSTEQLCQRRLDHVHQLRKLYEIELMNALEEQRSRHSHSQKSVPALDGTDTVLSEPYKPLKALLAERTGAACPGPAELAAPQQQPGAAAPAQERGQAAQAAEEPGVPSLSEAEEAYTAAPGGSADVSHLQAVRQRSRMRLSSIARLEQAASAGTARALDRAGALAELVSHRGRYLVKRSAVTLGRTTSTHGKVDVDLSPEQFAAKVSRQQARLYLKLDGTFCLTNTGRRKFLVNNCQVKRGDTAFLPHLSLVEIDNVRLLLMVNHLAVRRLLARSATFGDFPGN